MDNAEEIQNVTTFTGNVNDIGGYGKLKIWNSLT
jgi:hypothetical protein